MIKPPALIIVLGSYNLISAVTTATSRNLNNGMESPMEKFQEEVNDAKEITEYYQEMEGSGEEIVPPEPDFVYVPPTDPPKLANPKNFQFLHRPIPSAATATPVDVRTNSVPIEGVTTGVRVKVPPLSPEDQQKYGKWMFFDGYSKEFGEDRPVMDFSQYEAGDAPAEDFPMNSWQTDATYVMHFLDNAQKLVDRAREAIYEEYGFPVNGPSEERDKVFGFKKFRNDESVSGTPLGATDENFDGLVRRLLHAMMTNQEFKVALNGHSVAAGHDSNFWQSYIHQFHHVMEPIFARLGMKLSTYNYGRGGLGTLQDTLAGTCTLGDPDVLMWDSGMTELSKGAIDAFYRQAIISGTRVPFFINDRGNNPGEFARFNAKVPKEIMTTPLDEEKRKHVPYAVRYINCEASEMSCNKPVRKFNRGCWDDKITDFDPPTKQKVPPFGGQHPSWRSYQLLGRKLSLLFLHALEEAVVLWQDNTVIIGQFPLDDQYWHLTDHYDKVRKQTQESVAESNCMTKLHESLRKICSVPMRGRTEFTGRANPNRTALRTLVRPTADGYIPTNNKEVVYDKPITIDWQTIPEGEVDVRAIVGAGGFDDGIELRRQLLPEVSDAVNRPGRKLEEIPNVVRSYSNLRSLNGTDKIVPGNGWMMQDSVPAGYCDGSTDYHSCKRDSTNDCLAYDHHDTRSGIFGDSLSGWIVFDIDNVVEGFVVVKFETWHKGKVNERTKDWKTIDNERRVLHDWPNDIEIDVAVDGVITTYNFEMLEEKVIKAERVVEVMVLHDKKNAAPKDMEIAMRVRCTDTKSLEKHLCNINISHLYWA